MHYDAGSRPQLPEGMHLYGPVEVVSEGAGEDAGEDGARHGVQAHAVHACMHNMLSVSASCCG